MNIRYQVMWDNRPSSIGKRSKTAAAKAPKHDPEYYGPGDMHSSQNGLHGYINFDSTHGREARMWVERLKAQGYLGVSLWDTLNNPMSDLFRF